MEKLHPENCDVIIIGSADNKRIVEFAAIAAIVSIILGVFFWLLTFYFTPTPLSDYIKTYGMPFTVTTVVLGSVIAILTGINTSLIIYRKRMTGSLGFKKVCNY